MTNTYKPFNVIGIQGTPHIMPQKFNDWFPKFSRGNAITAKDHLSACFASLEDYNVGEHGDVSLQLFVKSLEGKDSLCFK